MKSKQGKIEALSEEIVNSPEKAELDKNIIANIRFSEDTAHRRSLIKWVKWTVSLWLAGVLSVITFNNILCLKLETGVQITLLATTTVNILGLAYIVLEGLFKESGKIKNNMP